MKKASKRFKKANPTKPTDPTRKPANLQQYLPDDRNVNKGSQIGDGLLEKSIQKNGLGRSILVSSDNVVIAGNKTLQKSAELGMEKVIEIETDGTELIVVKRKDIASKTKEFYDMAIADNQVQKHNYVEDAKVTEALTEEYQLENWGGGKKATDTEEDEVDPVRPKKPISKLADVYQLNQHRLLIGDSEDPDSVIKLFSGAKPRLMITDPPYGVNYDPSWRKDAGVNNSKRMGKVKNDDKASWRKAYALFGGDVAYVWHAGRYAGIVQDDLIHCGFDIVSQIIWNKQQFVMGRGDYHWKHEPCWYAVRKGVKHNWQGSRNESTIWDITSILQASKKGIENEAFIHGTQKPVECMARPIRNNTYERESIYDPFCGSGTTLIAAEQLNRAAFCMELDPGYGDIIVARWIKWMTEKDAATPIKLTKNGKPVSEKEQDKYLKLVFIS